MSKYAHLDTTDLLLLILDNDIDAKELSDKQILDIELHAMDIIAAKVVGGDHMVHWNASKYYQ